MDMLILSNCVLDNLEILNNFTSLFSQTKVFVRLEMIVCVYQTGVERSVIKVSGRT